MAVTSTSNSHATPGEVKDGDDVPSNLDAARPVLDRIIDIDRARDAEGGAASGNEVIDNTPETAMANEQAEADAKAAEEEQAKADKAEKAEARNPASKTTEKK